MKYRKFNKYERKEVRSQVIKNALAGSGLYLYQNTNPTGELTLSRPTKSGQRIIKPNAQFQGDSYYMQFVGKGLSLVEVLQTPEEEQQVFEADQHRSTEVDQNATEQDNEETLNESCQTTHNSNEEVDTMNESDEKLILDQPDQVTADGTVEHVVKKKTEQPINESTPDQQSQPVLLNESPVEDGFVIVEE